MCNAPLARTFCLHFDRLHRAATSSNSQPCLLPGEKNRSIVFKIEHSFWQLICLGDLLSGRIFVEGLSAAIDNAGHRRETRLRKKRLLGGRGPLEFVYRNVQITIHSIDEMIMADHRAVFAESSAGCCSCKPFSPLHRSARMKHRKRDRRNGVRFPRA